MLSMIKELWLHLSKRRKRQFWFLLMLMILASIMEVVSIGAVVPFLGVLTSPEQVYHHHLAQPIIQALAIESPNQLALPLTIGFVVVVLFAAVVRLLLLYVLTRLSYATGADLSVDIYRRTLYQDYSIHMSTNSSEVINGIITKTNTVIGAILVPALHLISSIIIMTGVVSVIFAINIQVALVTFLVFASFYGVITFFTKRALRKNSQLIASQSTKMVKSLQEGLGGIRDVLVDGAQEFYCELYREADLLLRRASGDNVFIGSSPRYLMESIGMILIVILAYILTLQDSGIYAAIPVLGALAIGAQKLLPSLQQAYTAYTAIKGAESSFSDVLDLLNQPLSEGVEASGLMPIPFNKEIVFKDVSFRYSENVPWVLKNINLTFKKGEKIGFVGVTGSGKSTLLDILMGLLSPTSGCVLVDGVSVTPENKKSWQMHISHVPQEIYLADSTVQENIAFGISPGDIEERRVSQAAEQAEISEVICNLKNGYKAVVGEKGSRLSVGQKQRIGVARALYKNSDVLILDEATSALDSHTEQKIMSKVNQLGGNRTIFIIAHRLTTLEQCDSIVRINQDHTVERLTYDQIK